MKLKGVEFFDYACFKRQFVPIKPGINLLVGKNNAGKTALLKGIAALSALPFQNWRHSHPEMQRFVKDLSAYLFDKDIPREKYNVDIYFELELGDAVPISADKASLNVLIKDGVIAIYSFTFIPVLAESQVLFTGARLRISKREPLEFISPSRSGYTFQTFHKFGDDFVKGNEQQINNGGRQIFHSDGKEYWIPVQSSDWFNALIPFSKTRYVAAHRAIAPWIGIQTADNLPDNAENLAVFLQTLRGNKAKQFQQIESKIKEIFPEVVSINPATKANLVQITISHHGMEYDVPLTHSGTGVEQVLAIVTFAVTAAPGSILLLDEPHSFLHPAAERQLIRFLKADEKHQYVIGTHSAVFINAVNAERITYVGAPGTPSDSPDQPTEVSRILFDLGYKNSDILFYDFLLIVEGKADRAILPILLERAGVDVGLIARTGFHLLEGAPERLRQIQAEINRWEKLIAALSQTRLPRLYLLDGDRAPKDKKSLQAMRNAEGNHATPVDFLPRTEIENYLLVADAIYSALLEEATLAEIKIDITVNDVANKIDQLLASDDTELFPHGKNVDPYKSVKGSKLLERLYAGVGDLVYKKEHSGVLIAKHIHADRQPALHELAELVENVLID
ncbi:MAG TPA: AAA family ATPase [Candidatus Angelobacter sp.]|nr:AAA family ATPase [Candidatus Angelobacter sp.]